MRDIDQKETTPVLFQMARRKIKYPEVGRRVSDLIAGAFRDRGLRKADIARAVKKDWTTIYVWSRGMAMPRPENLIDLASVLDTTPEYIQHGITPDRQLIKKTDSVDDDCGKKLNDYRRIIDTLMRQNESLQKQVDGLQVELADARKECCSLRGSAKALLNAAGRKEA